MEQSIKMEIDDGDSHVVASSSRALSDEEDPMQTDEKDILNSSAFGPNAKVFSCVLCEQKFTNKVSCDWPEYILAVFLIRNRNPF